MKKLAAILLAALLLAGCQLAAEGQETQGPSGDRMIGVLVTQESLNLFDMEAYLNDNINEIMADGEHVVSGDTSAYQGRLYADMSGGKCTFPGIEGFLLAYYEYEDNALRTETMPGISDGWCDYAISGSSTTMDITGTIYISNQAVEYCYFYNPVYQAADGSVYVMEGTGSSSHNTDGIFPTSTHTRTESCTITSQDGEEHYEASVAITVQPMALPEKYVLISMDEAHRELGRVAYTPEELPEEIDTAPGAAYLLVESHSTDADGQICITRTIHSPDDTFRTLDVYTLMGEEVCIKSTTKINWN